MLVTFVSFFNELATEKRNYARNLCFMFLMILPQRGKNYARGSCFIF